MNKKKKKHSKIVKRKVIGKWTVELYETLEKTQEPKEVPKVIY